MSSELGAGDLLERDDDGDQDDNEATSPAVLVSPRKSSMMIDIN